MYLIMEVKIGLLIVILWKIINGSDVLFVVDFGDGI